MKDLKRVSSSPRGEESRRHFSEIDAFGTSQRINSIQKGRVGRGGK